MFSKTIKGIIASAFFVYNLHGPAYPGAENLNGVSCGSCHTTPKTAMPENHPSMDAADEALCQRIRNIFKDVERKRYLRSHHAGQEVSCADCHGDELPELGAEPDTDVCLTCHKGYAALTENTESRMVPEQNPHQSHLGAIDCSVCHHAHAASRSYCLECHTNFTMPMPGSH